MLAVLAVGGQLARRRRAVVRRPLGLSLYSMTTGMSASSVAGAYAELRRASAPPSGSCSASRRPPRRRAPRRAHARKVRWLGRVQRRAVRLPADGGVAVAARRAGGRRLCGGAALRRDRRPTGSGKSTLAALLAGALQSRPREECASAASTSPQRAPSHLRTELLSVVPRASPHCSPAATTTSRSAAGRERRQDAAAAAAGCAFADGDWGREVGERGLQLSR